MWRVAIPSYNRVKELGEKTLLTLEHHKVPKNLIDIFVANQEQYELYINEYPDYNIVIAVIGMKDVRNFIFQEHYKEGDWIVSMDDDIEKIRMKNPRGWEDSSYCDDELDLMTEINLAFSECMKSKRSLWGLYPVDNHYFMKNQISYDYKFCGGWMWGVINKKELTKLDISDGCMEDYERCIKHYLQEGGMVRLNYICCKTKYGNAKGGMGIIDNRDRVGFMKELEERYPNLFYLKQKKDGLNPILKDKRN